MCLNYLLEHKAEAFSRGVKMKKTIYEIAICVLAITSVVFAIIDMTSGMPAWMAITDTVIYFIFLIDYVARFILAKNKKEFFKSNIFDFIAIIPFSSMMRVFRALKIFRLAKLSKVTRILSVSGRLFARCKRFLNTNGLKYVLLVSALLIIIGGGLVSIFEDMSFMDGMWWAFVTSTTVGYGDISPSTMPGRAIAIILMISGIGLIGSLTSSITSFFMKNDNETISNDRVDMVIKMYNELNDSEKELFKEKL